MTGERRLVSEVILPGTAATVRSGHRLRVLSRSIFHVVPTFSMVAFFSH